MVSQHVALDASSVVRRSENSPSHVSDGARKRHACLRLIYCNLGARPLRSSVAIQTDVTLLARRLMRHGGRSRAGMPYRPRTGPLIRSSPASSEARTPPPELPLQARRDVDAVAVKVVVFNDDIAKIDADSEHDGRLDSSYFGSLFGERCDGDRIAEHIVNQANRSRR